MNKKGFTLIEIIAAIGILAIILLVVIPNINSLISTNKTRLYEEQENRLKEAAIKYLNDIYFEETDTMVVTKDVLINGGYINEMYDLGNKSSECQGYVDITNYLTNPVFTSYISCLGYETTGYDSEKLN